MVGGLIVGVGWLGGWVVRSLLVGSGVSHSGREGGREGVDRWVDLVG
jgi:hypothetical protein